MTVTIQPTVFKFTLACGHEQYASYSLPVGHGYPCWTACDNENPVRSHVVSVERYHPQQNEAFVVASGANNADMLHIQRVVDEANTRLAQ